MTYTLPPVIGNKSTRVELKVYRDNYFLGTFATDVTALEEVIRHEAERFVEYESKTRQGDYKIVKTGI